MNPPSEEQRLAARERPAGEKPVMYQTWSQLLFLHWTLSAEAVQETLPEGLFVDTYEGAAWVGVVPFEMRNIRPRGMCALPWISDFLELNVRTYVHDEAGNPGVWFYSLDTNRWLAYRIARTFFKLSYFPARMSATRHAGGNLDYRTCRKGAAREESRMVYRPDEGGEAVVAAPGTLEFFLLERYLLFSHDGKRNRLFTGQVHHAPYRYRPAVVEKWDTLPAQWDALPGLVGDPVHQCVAEPVDVEVFSLRKASLTGSSASARN